MARGAPGEQVYTPEVQAEDLPRKIVPHAETASIGPGLQSLANTADSVNQKAIADNATWAGDQLAQRRIKAVTDLQAAQASAPAGDQTGFTAKYLAQFDKDNDPLMQSASNSIARPMIEKGLTDLRQTLQLSSQKWEAEQNVAYRSDSFQNNLKSQLPIVEAHPEMARSVGSSLNDQLQASGMEPSKRLPYLREMDAQLSQAAANGLTRQNPQGVLDALNHPESVPSNLKPLLDLNDQQREATRAKASGMLSDNYANSVVDTYRKQGPSVGSQALAAIDKTDQPDEIKSAIYSKIEKGLGELRNEARQTNASEVMGFEERMAAGKPNPNDRGVVMDLFHKMVFSPEQAGENLGRIEKAQEKAVEDTANRDFAADAYKNGRAIDPQAATVKDGIGTLFTERTQNVQPGSQEWINTGADIAAKTGVTPEPVMSWARAKLVGGDPQTAVQAADTIQRQQDANPRGVGYALDDKTKAMARIINDQTMAGTDAVTAVQNARTITAMPDAQKQALEALYKKQGIAAKAPTALSTQLKNDPKFQTGWFESNPTIPPQMVGEYQELRSDYWKLTNGDPKQTDSLAFADLKNTWGVSQVNGKKEYMQFAPEAMNPGLTTDALRKDMEDTVKGHTDDPTKVRLGATSETMHSEGQRWALQVPDKNGRYANVTDDRGRVLPYQLPNGTQAFMAGQAKAKADGLQKLRDQIAAQKAQEAAEISSASESSRMGAF